MMGEQCGRCGEIVFTDKGEVYAEKLRRDQVGELRELRKRKSRAGFDDERLANVLDSVIARFVCPICFDDHSTPAFYWEFLKEKSQLNWRKLRDAIGRSCDECAR